MSSTNAQTNTQTNVESKDAFETTSPSPSKSTLRVITYASDDISEISYDPGFIPVLSPIQEETFVHKQSTYDNKSSRGSNGRQIQYGYQSQTPTFAMFHPDAIQTRWTETESDHELAK